MKLKRCWVVMKAQEWGRIMADGQKLNAPVDGPDKWIAVFYDKKQALKFNGGDGTHIVEAEIKDAQ